MKFCEKITYEQYVMRIKYLGRWFKNLPSRAAKVPNFVNITITHTPERQTFLEMQLVCLILKFLKEIKNI